MKASARFAFFGQAVALGAVLCLSTSAATAVDLALSASTTTPAVGGTFTVTISSVSAQPFAVWGTFLRFDPAKVQLLSQAGGSFTTFVADSRGLAAINASGEARLGGYSLSNNTGGNGTLALLTFRAAAAGTTVLSSENYAAGNLFGNALIPLNGAKVLPNILNSLTIAIGGGLSSTVKGDFDGDRKADILLRQPSSGAVYLWLMQ